MTDDKLEQFITDAARDYQAPPATPRKEIWARIEAARRPGPAARPVPVIPIGSRRRWLVSATALAAVLVLGIAIGRWAERAGTGPAPTLAAGPLPADSAAIAARAATMLRFAAVEHLGRIDALLTDYQTGAVSADFPGTARSLLAKTRLLLDSRLTDPTIRRLLEDLEVLLLQAAQLAPDGQAGDRALIDENLAERAIRPRLRNALPAGPTA